MVHFSPRRNVPLHLPFQRAAHRWVLRSSLLLISDFLPDDGCFVFHALKFGDFISVMVCGVPVGEVH